MKVDEGRKLGFGCMRMPFLGDDQTNIDYPKLEALFDEFLAEGFTYFDTAYTYHGYHAEEIVRKALVERHPRDSFQLATKMPLRDFQDTADLRHIFDEQLKNCGVDHFDYYLLHNMGANVHDKCEKYGAFEFLDQVKASGETTFAGMSFHDMPELLEEILEAHADSLDFVQLQINYADWEQPNVQSRRCLEVARKYGKPVVVMEPCKGGTLVNVPDEARELMEAAEPDASTASWALRFAASQPSVIRVLSGMNEMEQVRDNCATFADFRPVTDEELDVIWKVRDIIDSQTAIPCTACEYCTHDCPQHIAIPKFFALYNNVKRTTGSFSSHHVYYNNTVLGGSGKASDCIRCGLCEKACPQHLPIRDLLEDVAATFETQSFPTRK
ncbi:MAG: aldo/keto reductase [Coriobacteriales bacterium]